MVFWFWFCFYVSRQIGQFMNNNWILCYYIFISKISESCIYFIDNGVWSWMIWLETRSADSLYAFWSSKIMNWALKKLWAIWIIARQALQVSSLLFQTDWPRNVLSVAIFVSNQLTCLNASFSLEVDHRTKWTICHVQKHYP